MENNTKDNTVCKCLVKKFRITVLLNQFFTDHRSIALLYLKENIKTIADLEQKIADTFNINNFFLTCNNKFLPATQDKRILEKDDTVWVNKINIIKIDEAIGTENTVEPEIKKVKPRKKNRRNSSTEEINHETEITVKNEETVTRKRKSPDNEPNLKSTLKKTKKKSKRIEEHMSCEEENHELPSPIQNKTKNQALQPIEPLESSLYEEIQKKCEEIQQNCEEIQQACDEIPNNCADNKINVSSVIIIPPTTTTTKINESLTESEQINNITPNNNVNVKLNRKTYFGIGNTVNLLRGCNSGLEVKRKRKRKRVRKSKSSIIEFKPELTTNIIKPVIKIGDANTHIKFDDQGSNTIAGNTSSSSSSSDEDETQSKQDKSIKNGGDTSVTSSLSYNSYDKETTLHNDTQNICNDQPFTNLTNNSESVKVIWTRNNPIKEFVKEGYNGSENTGFVRYNGHLVPVKEETIMKHPLMKDVQPQEGDVISFKILKITESCTPEVSTFITGIVVTFEGGVVTFDIIHGEDQCITPEHRLLCKDDDLADNNIETNFIWSHLIEPRKLFVIVEPQLNKI